MGLLRCHRVEAADVAEDLLQGAQFLAAGRGLTGVDVDDLSFGTIAQLDPVTELERPPFRACQVARLLHFEKSIGVVA